MVKAHIRKGEVYSWNAWNNRPTIKASWKSIEIDMAKLLLLYHLIGSYEKEDAGEKLLQLRASASWALTGLLTSQKVITVGRSTRCRAEKVHCNIYRIILWLYGCIAYYAPQHHGTRAETDKPGEYAWRFNRVAVIGVDVRNRKKITYTCQQQLMRRAIGSTIVFVLFYFDKNLGTSRGRTPCHWIKGLLSGESHFNTILIKNILFRAGDLCKPWLFRFFRLF